VLSSWIRFLFILLIITFALAACGSGESDEPVDNSPIVDLLINSYKLNIENGDNLISLESENGIEIHHNDLKLIETVLNFELQFSTEVAATVNCTFQNKTITANGSGFYTIQFSPAYLEELIEFRCLHRGVEVYYNNFKLFASDEQIDKELANYLKYLPQYELNNFNSLETDLRRINFYYEMHQIISASQIYTSPQSFALNEISDEYIKIENYFIINHSPDIFCSTANALISDFRR